MGNWTVAVHRLAEPELQALPADMKARFLRIAELLEDFGPQHVGMPHVRPLEGKL
jgi:mRNA-degrading endonuclease RelE of RelBE toxin-antitoxin system